MGAPPVDVGGVKETDADPSPGVAVPMTGAPGAVTGLGATASKSVLADFCGGLAESLATNPIWLLPFAVGVPEIAPAGLSDSPDGIRAPAASVQVTVPIPPVLASCAVYG
jgi:hypothetical protein